jgi:diguanylate cyclase (GGDEF)-like protein
LEPVRLHATLNWIIDTAADLVPGDDLEGTLERYLDRLLEWLGAEQGSIMLLHGEDELSIVASRGLDKEVKPGMRVRLHEGPAGEVVVEGKARLITGKIPSRRKNHRPKSAMIIPIRAQEKIVGVLNVGKLSGAAAFTPEDLQTISVVAAQLAWILSNFELMSKMWTLAITDELTGLFNRRYFFLRLREEVRRAERYDKPMCVVMLDLDGFKELNRLHGHLIGDEILQQVCGVVRRNLRAVDMAARYGGDEIVAILPETPVAAGFAIITRLQAAVGEEIFVGHNGVPVKLSLCAGIAQFPGDAANPDDLIRKADVALLEAKAAGSGRVLLAD